MTLGAKPLGIVAARAVGVVASRHRTMDREEVVPMDTSRTNATIVAIDALTFRVTRHAKLSRVRRDPAVPNQKILVVLHSGKPTWWEHSCLTEFGLHASVRQIEMARRALRRRPVYVAPRNLSAVTT